ncbi:DUF6035 family protein, partial [Acinetobacter sp. P8-3-8]|uniref:DUF7829 domain-containing protein n=1 Tax=Acinetobacter sp. P8-3-8 TaxID=1029823 RepID=UPI000248606E
YSSYWEYIEFAFKKYNLWDYLIKLDSSKGTFQRKLQELYSSFPEQKYDFEEIFQTLYPELI